MADLTVRRAKTTVTTVSRFKFWIFAVKILLSLYYYTLHRRVQQINGEFVFYSQKWSEQLTSSSETAFSKLDFKLTLSLPPWCPISQPVWKKEFTLH